MKLEAYLLDLAERRRRTLLDRVVVLFLTVLEWLYRSAVALRRTLFYWRILPSLKLPVPVVAVGNLAAGGTGKTPFTIFLARRLKEGGYRPAVLIRGYRGQGKGVRVVSDTAKVNLGLDETGDEAQLLARSLPGIPVVAGANRYRSGSQAIKLGADILIMDDGFQHLALRRDRDIVLLDAKRPFENGHLLPRGLLREGKNGLNRAHLLVLSGNAPLSPKRWQSICDEVNRWNQHVPLVRAGIQPGNLQLLADWWQAESGISYPGDFLKNKTIRAFTAIGRPEKFFATLRELGARLESVWTRPDHYRWRPEDFSPAETATGSDGTLLITTEKDAVKLEFLLETPVAKRIYVLPIRPVLTEEDLSVVDHVLKGLKS